MRKMSLFGILLFTFLCSFAAVGSTLDFKLPLSEGTPVPFDQYEVYYGDFDQDFYQDLYFHGLVPKTVTDTQQVSPPGFAYFGIPEGGYHSASPWDMTTEALRACYSCALAQAGVDYVLGDMDGDGFPEILVKGRDANQSSLLISGLDDGNLPRILLEILPTGHVRVPGQEASREPYFRNNLRDAETKIANGRLLVDGMGHDLNQMRLAAGRNQATTAKNLTPQGLAALNGTSSTVSTLNIPAPPTPSLPSHSLSAAQIADIDALASVGGEFRVNEMGAATYTIPLALPVGTAGVTPEVALVYSSQAGIGNMGLGWSLQAGGAITRCRQTLQQDGVALPIEFNEQDRFCLDGQRLITASGTYGANGTEYKTEIDSGVIVTSIGGTTGHPDYFEVRAKDGSVSRYGGSGNHNSEQRGRNASGALLTNRTFAWNLSEFKDSVGNQVVYTYVSGTSYFRLSSIAYGYGASTTADVQVTFQYGTRKKSEIEWIKDSRFEDNSRLNSVQIRDKNILVREYKISYNLASAGALNDLADRVTSIDNCLDSICAQPLKLSWGFPSPGAASKGNGKVTTYSNNLFSFETAGFTSNGHPAERITEGDRSIPSWSVNNLSLVNLAPGQFIHTYQESDINGDGRSDLLIMTANTANPKSFRLFTLRQTDLGFTELQQVETLPGDPTVSGGEQDPRLFPVDFNADGRMDVAVYLPSSNAWRTYFSEPQINGTWKLVRVDNFLPANMPDDLRFTDINSDGLADLIYMRGDNLHVHYLKRTGAITDIRAYSYSSVQDFFVSSPNFQTYNFSGMSDLNEDGRVDLLAVSVRAQTRTVSPFSWCEIQFDSTWMMPVGVNTFQQFSLLAHFGEEYSEGTTLFPEFSCTSAYYRNRIVGPTASDINGDGLLDMTWATKKLFGYSHEFRSINYRLGRSNFQFGDIQQLTLNFDAYAFEFLDTDSDGDQDLLITGQNDAQWIARWNGTGFDAPVLHLAAQAGRQTRYTDIDGDGNIDRLTLKDGKLTITRGRPRINSVVIRFESGLDVFTNVAYEPLRDSARYQKLEGFQNVQTGTTPGGSICPPVAGMPCTTYSPQPIYTVNSSEFYRQINNPFAGVDTETDLELYKGVPAQEFISTMPVVTRVVSSAPTAANANQLAGVDYRYEGLKIQAGGRGMLGFKKLTTTDMQTGVTTTTEYRQDWPFMGTPVRTTTSTHHGQLLSESTSRMRIYGITTSNITSKRNLAKQGTTKLGPLVLHTQESRDITYSPPQELLAMPGSGQSAPSPTQIKLKEVVTTIQVDAHGNTSRVQVNTLNGVGSVAQTQTTVNTYYPGDGERLGRLQRSVVTTSRPGIPTRINKVDFTYYGYPGAPANCSGASLAGLLCSEQTTSDDLTNSVQPAATLHFYDSRGNKTHTRTGTRVSPFAQYDGKGRFVQATYDVFANGVLAADSAPSGYPPPSGAVVIKTSEVLERDKFGNALRSRSRVGQNTWLEQVQASTPMGTVFFKGDGTGAFEQTRLQKTSTDANCPANTVFIKTATQAGGAEATECYDKLGRAIGAYKLALQGGAVRTQQDYDVLGRVVRVFEPAFTAPTLSTNTVYDVLGRPVLVTHPFFVTDTNGVESSTLATTRYFYNGFATTTHHSGHTGVPERSRMEIVNALGELYIVVESGSRALLYDYDALGNLTLTRNSAGNEITSTYNGLGQKIGMQDPDKGTFSYQYNAFGELYAQTDAEGTTTVNLMDFKGRRTTEVVSPRTGSTQAAFVNVWEYDRSANGIGQVNKETKGATATEFTRISTFDVLGRASTISTQFSGANGTQEIHQQKITYDQFGRVFQAFDAARTGADFTRNGIENVYNERGYLTKVKDAASAESYYEIRSTDVRGNANVVIYGNGEGVVSVYHPRTGFLTDILRAGVLGTTQSWKATWDHLGNMTSRKDSLLGDTVETFQYDGFNRLTRNTLAGSSVNVTYDILDNITSKSDFESGATYEYHASKKHAAKKVGTREYEYDANGNVVQEKRGGSIAKTLTYNAKDQVIKITHNGHTSEFFYGSDNQRYKRIDTDSQGRRTTTLYLGSVEKIHYHDGVVEWKRQVGGIAQITHRVTNGTPDTGTKHYFHKDHLGSITTITDGNGNVLRRMAFDPWGARRNINTSNVWQPTVMSHSSILASYAKTTKPYTNRGYTSHEMLDEVGIIHMNGRIYDAYLARFLQADPFIQAPTLAASLNRYSYVMNNPMNAVDPSGYFSLSKSFKKGFKRAFKYTGAEAVFKTIAGSQTLMMIVSIAVNFIPGCQGWCTVAVQAAFQAGTTYAMTGSLNAAFRSGAIGFASGAAFMGIGSAGFGQSFSTGAGSHIARSLAHGMVGGIGSVLQGGKFGHGFASAGLTKFINVNAAFDKAGMGSVKFDNARIAAAAILGGTISDATGGKFANGAMTAAMGQALNGNPQNAREQVDKLATKTIKKYMGPSNSEKREYGGFIYEDDKGRLGVAVTEPGPICAGSDCGVDMSTAKIPDNARAIASWHTHPAVSNSPIFSPDDIIQTNSWGISYGYLGSPDGNVYRYQANAIDTTGMNMYMITDAQIRRASEIVGRWRR